MNLLTYFRVALSVFREIRKRDSKRSWIDTSIVLSWITGYPVAWWLSIDLLLLEYSALPITDPNCYVASAAANGHRQLVGSQKQKTTNGDTFVNLQMQRVKFLEFVLLAMCPTLHKPIRRAYNRFGPRLASVCSRNKFAADLTYLSLKPVEWTAELLRFGYGFSSTRIRRIYMRND